MSTHTLLRSFPLAACAVCLAPISVPAAASAATAPAAGDRAQRGGESAAKRSKPARPRRTRLRAGITRHVLAGDPLRVRGRLRPRLRGRTIRLQLRTSRGWPTVKRTRTGRGGRFRIGWRPPAAGRYRLRVRYAGGGGTRRSGDVLGRAHVYRGAQASWYGPGLYGNHTACGGRLTPGRLGVAHRWLPCGARVTFRYRDRSVTVPVIDRGPFAGAREWDLTAATKARLGFGDVGVVLSTR